MTTHLRDGLTPGKKIQHLAFSGSHNNVHSNQYRFVDKEGQGIKKERGLFSQIDIIYPDKHSKENLYIDKEGHIQRGYYKCTILEEETVVYKDKYLNDIPVNNILTFHEMHKYTNEYGSPKTGCYSAGDRYFTKYFKEIPLKRVDTPIKTTRPPLKTQGHQRGSLEKPEKVKPVQLGLF